MVNNIVLLPKKLIYIFLTLLFVFSHIETLMATPSEVLDHYILRDRYLRGGMAKIFVLENDEYYSDTFTGKIDYVIYPRAGVPIPREHRKGSFSQKLPIEFLNEQGYLDLEILGTQDIGKAIIIHQGRADIDRFKNCHVVKVIPKKEKWNVIVYYHPSVPSIGWVSAKVTLFDLPVIKQHTITTFLKDKN